MAGDVALSQDDLDNLLSGGLEESSSESESTPQQPSSQAQEPSADSSGDVFQGLDNLLGGGDSAPASSGEGSGSGTQPSGGGQASQQQNAQFGLQNIEAFGNLSALMNVVIDINVQLGKKDQMIKDILSLGEGSIIELDKPAGDPVDVMAKDRPLARGEVVVVDEQFGVRITEKVDPSKHI